MTFQQYNGKSTNDIFQIIKLENAIFHFLY